MPTSCFRYSTHQSYITPSAVMPAKISSPMISSSPRGQAKCAFSPSPPPAAGWVSSMPREATSTISAMPAQTLNSCSRGATPAPNSTDANPAPSMPPTLNMPCRLLMTARPLRLSSSEPSVLIDTSNRLIAAPNSSIAGSSSARPGYSSTMASSRHITSAARGRGVARAEAPDHPPGDEQRRTAPTAAASSTIDSTASPSAVLRLDRRDVRAPGAAEETRARRTAPAWPSARAPGC